VVLCRSSQEAAGALAVVQQWTAEAGAKSLKKFKNAIRAKTKRTAGQPVSDHRSSRTATARCAAGLRTSNKPPLDGWIRRRLRNILRKQQGRSGISLACDNITCRNAFFAQRGPFSLRDAYAQARQSGCGSARPVRREGSRTQSAFPSPIS
jgi:RNA-directed DNA polymerase